jgi:hypothetical protein
MAFTRVSGKMKYYKYSECTPGQVLVENGVYLGSEEGKFGIQHLFREEDGSKVCLNSAGHLNYLIDESAVPGMKCRVTYAEKVLLDSGSFKGKEAHNFDLDIDTDDLKNIKPGHKLSADIPKDGDDISL